MKPIPAIALGGHAWEPALAPRDEGADTRLHVAEHKGALPTFIRLAWADLAGQAAEPNCFAEPWFVEAGLRHLAPGADIRMLVITGTEGELIGVLPAVISDSYGRMRIAHVENWRHHHDFLGTPLVRRGRERAFWRALLHHMDEADWASGFFHVDGLVEQGPLHSGLLEAAKALGRKAPTVHRVERAALESRLTPDAYYEGNVRKKKRKELKRLRNRLEELGDVGFACWQQGESVEPWCEEFLALERSGWKGAAGSALGCAPATADFFRDVLNGAATAGRLEMLKLTLNEAPIAMMINFIAPPGSFSFKIAHDERYARFSPGVLIELENLRILERPDVAWMDSCASEKHAMIDSLWGERRSIIRVTVPLTGLRRRAIFTTCHALERLSAARRGLQARMGQWA
jgi:CelD/BcsL family acetyltransferase involved in cellulose biosynthesis